jgi:hypothetical protein
MRVRAHTRFAQTCACLSVRVVWSSAGPAGPTVRVGRPGQARQLQSESLTAARLQGLLLEKWRVGELGLILVQVG